MKFACSFLKALNGIMILGMVFSSLEAPTRSAMSTAANVPQAGRLSVASAGCLTQAVRITLASEQISFCSPTSLSINVVEDGTTDPSVNYAGLNQVEGYGIINIKAVTPENSPGSGMPVYNSGGAVKYRQEIWDLETAKTDRLVSHGPSADFWGQTVPGIQVDLTLTTSLGDLPLRSIEWYLEHDNRLWSLSIAWDTGMPNAAEWDQASGNFSVQTPLDKKLADTALDLGAAFLASQSAPGEVRAAGVVDMGAPSWWNGVCDENNYHQHTSPHTDSTLLATWHGVSACGPIGGPDYGVYFPGATWGMFEFECVELVMRFLYLEWGIMPWQGNGNTIMNNPPSSLVFYPNDGTHVIIPGDAITENASPQNSAGHTMIVTTVSLDGNGTGYISILEQNASHNGSRSLHMTSWTVDPDPYCFHQTIQGWLHAKANQADGDPDPAFLPTGTGLNGPVNVMGLQSDKKIVVGGEFTGYNGTARSHIARLNTDGSLDTTFDPGSGVMVTSGTPQVFALKVQSNDKLLIGGQFDQYNTTPRNNIARLATNGQIDTTFTPPPAMSATTGNPSVNALAVQSDNNILLGGNFNSLDSNPHNFIAQLNNAGAVDTSFTASTDGIVYALAVQSDGRILIGGVFTHVDGASRSGIARLNSDGSLDSTFNPGGAGTAGAAVSSIALQEDKILIAGNFSSYNGTSRNMIARLNGNGSLDTTFNPGIGVSGTSAFLQTVVSQPDGRIFIGGKFSAYNGTTLYNFIRLNYDGTRDVSFLARGDFAGADHNQIVKTILLQPDNKILVGGNFTGFVAHLLNHIESCYTLTVLASPMAGGSVNASPAPNCPGGKYINGTVVQLTAVPDTGADYWFINWSGAASGAANPVSVTMNANQSVTANFMASPGLFNKTSPADGTNNQPVDISLSWEASVGVASYEYCLDTTNNDTCDSGVWISTGLSTSVSLTNLLPSATYYWQVRARNLVDITDARNGWWSFSRNDIPAVPVTVSPGGAVFIDNQPPYIWNGSNGATSYHLVVHSISAATDMIDENVSSSSCSAGVCTYHPAGPLPVGDYEFKVSAFASGTSDFSAWRTFNVGIPLFIPVIISSGGG